MYNLYIFKGNILKRAERERFTGELVWDNWNIHMATVSCVPTFSIRSNNISHFFNRIYLVNSIATIVAYFPLR